MVQSWDRDSTYRSMVDFGQPERRVKTEKTKSRKTRRCHTRVILLPSGGANMSMSIVSTSQQKSTFHREKDSGPPEAGRNWAAQGPPRSKPPRRPRVRPSHRFRGAPAGSASSRELGRAETSTYYSTG